MWWGCFLIRDTVCTEVCFVGLYKNVYTGIGFIRADVSFKLVALLILHHGFLSGFPISYWNSGFTYFFPLSVFTSDILMLSFAACTLEIASRWPSVSANYLCSEVNGVGRWSAHISSFCGINTCIWYLLTSVCNLPLSLYLMAVSCRQNVVGLFFFIKKTFFLECFLTVWLL
jgi:hypothetical protein